MQQQTNYKVKQQQGYVRDPLIEERGELNVTVHACSETSRTLITIPSRLAASGMRY